jgi:hypothetical protein
LGGKGELEMRSLALVLVLVSAAAVVLAVRASFSSTSCIGAQEGAGQPGPLPPAAADLSPEIIEGWIANQQDLVPPLTTPIVEGTPPLGFSSWDAFAEYTRSYLDPNAPATAELQAGTGGAVGGVAELPHLVKSSQSDCP